MFGCKLRESSSLAIQYWPLYRIVNEKEKSIADLWDGDSLRCTFRRTVSEDFVSPNQK